MKNIQINISKLDFMKPISYYSNKYELSNNATRNRFKKLGVYEKFVFTKGHVTTIRSNLLKKQYDDNPKCCLHCKEKLPYDKRNNDFCSTSCSSTYNQKDGGNCHWSISDREKRSVWGKEYAYRHPKIGYNKACLNCGNEFYVSQSQTDQKCCSKICASKWITDTGYMKGKTGGYRKEAGRGKMGWYKGYYCNSSWELAWVIYQLEHGLKFKRNTEGFEYLFESQKYKFYPDFKLIDDNFFFEIKGWITKKDEEKIKQFKYPMKVLYKKDLKDVFHYVVTKYGKDYTSLYEK